MKDLKQFLVEHSIQHKNGLITYGKSSLSYLDFVISYPEFMDLNAIEVQTLIVPENEQGKGIGTILIKEIIKIAHKLNKDILILCSELTNTDIEYNIKFYQKHGFEIIKREGKHAFMLYRI